MTLRRHNRVTLGRHAHVPLRYVPRHLTKKDQERQRRALRRSRKLYRQGIYVERPPVPSFRSRPSRHVQRAYQYYHITSMTPNRALAKKTGCSVAGLRAIVRKGEGAYYASGSRPNQTARSWGYARLASAITGAKAAQVDRHLLEAHCDPRSPARKLAANRTLL